MNKLRNMHEITSAFDARGPYCLSWQRQRVTDRKCTNAEVISCSLLSKIIIIFNVLLINLSFNLCWGKTVHIRVTEARDYGIKLVVLPFNNDHKKTNDIASIITNDLNYSGQFKVLDLDLENQELIEKIPTNASPQEIDFRFWRNLGAEYLLITKLYPTKNASSIVVNLQLLDLYKPLNPLSLNTEIEKYPNEDPRKLSHRISNVIFEKLTGVKGFFNTKIAYIRVEGLGEESPVYSLNIADPDGFNEHKLISTNYPLMSPNWSKDGKQLSFVSFKNNRANISIADLKSGKITIITKYPGINGAPAWSPDGSKLALVLSKDGSPKIYTLELDNGYLQKITTGMSIDTEPFWNNNGTEIFFTSNRGGKPQIYKVSLLDGEIKRITFKGDYNATPSLTPDNRNLVMLHCTENCSKTELGYNIAVQSLDSGNVKILTKIGMEDSPVISPNGVLVLYSTESNKNDNNRTLAAVSLDGNFGTYLPIPGNGSVKNPAWSPFLE